MSNYCVRLEIKWNSGKCTNEFFTTWMEANAYLHAFEHQMVKWTAHKA